MATNSKHSTSKPSTAKRASAVRAKKATTTTHIRATTKKTASASAPAPAASKGSATRKSAKKWSADVTAHSDALDLKNEVFKLKDPEAIAASLKQSADASKRKKGTPYQSAMSMLNFYINRAGKNLPATQHKVLERAKAALRAAYGRE